VAWTEDEKRRNLYGARAAIVYKYQQEEDDPEVGLRND